MNASILVSSVCERRIPTGDRNNVGRYAEVYPLQGKRIGTGTIATFIGRNGIQVRGMVVQYPGACANGSIVVDTFRQ